MNLLKKITSTFLLFATIAGFAQINYPGKVIINEDINIASVQVIKYDVSKVDERVPLKNGKALTPLKVDEFATHVESDISPKTHGTWTNSKDGKRIWTLAIHHKEAKSIQIVCDPFMLNKGVKLFVTDPEQKHTAGAFTFRNNRSNNIFAITPISGNYLLVQLQLEKYVSDIGDFKISSLGFELADNNKLKGATDEWYGTSAYCHVDVSCMKGDNFGFYKNAVVRIITNGRRCTGSLVNNTLQDSKPYILTAGHCIKNEYEAATAVYYFNYESPYCNGPDVAFNSMSGSSLRVRLGFDSLDFCLTELHMIPPTNYAPLYAGWNYTNDPATSTFSFHHPEGDVKKIT
ncbi:MAG: hypothetical protein MI922_11950, partial [Bacteroidales bacterium]|nr:hypothetical protein [Bacteroidales bacterium]